MTISRSLPPAWSPRELIAHVAKQTLDAFCEEFFHDHFLVVRLDDFSSELAAGLGATQVVSSSAPPRRNTLTFSMAVHVAGEVAGTGLTSLPSPAGRPSVSIDHDSNFAADLVHLRHAPCHVLPLKKRTPSPPVGILSVGRSPDRDIVLQHPSVSRIHAQFDLSGDLVLVDLGSSNHTFVRGERIAGRVPVAAGDSVKFGAVHCRIWSPAGLWRAVRG